jgi:hypothetical protein
MIDINALDVLNQRKVNVVHPQFAKFKVADVEWNHEDIEDWVRVKLKGRFYIQRLPSVSSDGKLKSSTFVGFEDHKELTYFMLACPHLRRK